MDLSKDQPHFGSISEYAAAVTRVLKRHDCHEEPVHPDNHLENWHMGKTPMWAAAQEILPEDEREPGDEDDWVKAIESCDDCRVKELLITSLSR